MGSNEEASPGEGRVATLGKQQMKRRASFDACGIGGKSGVLERILTQRQEDVRREFPHSYIAGRRRRIVAGRLCVCARTRPSAGRSQDEQSGTGQLCCRPASKRQSAWLHG